MLSLLAGLAIIAGALASLALLALGLAGFTPEVEPRKRDRYRAAAYAAALLGSAALAGSLAALTLGFTLLAAIVGGAPVPFAIAVVAWIESRRPEDQPSTHPGLAHPELKPTSRPSAFRISRTHVIPTDADPVPNTSHPESASPTLVSDEPSRPMPPRI
ncbi:MAG: hypothetical protein HRU70_05460 [Phycisphaeraceae bacterium]|nr:MAG: hypothetical protein HRU70_05460 [Phycisphaeraceae bacterium]